VNPLPSSALPTQGSHVVLAERPQAGLGIDLGGGQVQVAEELPHLVDRHMAGIEQDGGVSSNGTENRRKPPSTRCPIG
jgi:hypothetical protein